MFNVKANPEGPKEGWLKVDHIQKNMDHGNKGQFIWVKTTPKLKHTLKN
jgi:hypothetical protein